MKNTSTKKPMSVKLRRSLVISCVAILLIAVSFLSVALSFAGRTNKERWTKEDVFTLDYTVQLQKQPGKNFVILNLSDIQIDDDGEDFAVAKYQINRLIEYKKPDLITLTGDQVWRGNQYENTKKLMTFIDGYGIPFAPVFGNHDGEKLLVKRNLLADLYMEFDNCVFKKGPARMGGPTTPSVGNYIITVIENGEVVKAIYMIDSNAYAASGEGYDSIHERQIEWYEWAVKGLASVTGKNVESLAFFHIPLPEIRDVFKNYNSNYNPPPESAHGVDKNVQGVDTGDNPAAIYSLSTVTTETAAEEPFLEGGSVYYKDDFASSRTNTHFYDKIKELGSTKFLFNGHDHTNNFSLTYQGVTFTYCVKTGSGAYNNADRTGGTFVSLAAADSTVSIEHHILAR